MSAIDVQPLQLARTAARAIDDKKGEDIVIFAVGDVLAITEYFVISSASNRRLVRTLVEGVEEDVRTRFGRSPLRVEGLAETQWVLMDYGDIVVHVFSDEMRAYYEIERLYRDVPKIEWQEPEE
jgi:ribosome-associated protein